MKKRKNDEREKVFKNGIYIPSIDAKDIYLAEKSKENKQFDLTLRNDKTKYNLRKFINCMDYSLDLLELLPVYYRKYRRKDFAFKVKNNFYSTKVINITFKYAVHAWNKICKDTYIKLGYDYDNLIFCDNIARSGNGEIVGIILNNKIDTTIPPEDLPGYFEISDVSRKKAGVLENYKVYKQAKIFKTVVTNKTLRKMLYNRGFVCNDIKYCRLKRSSGSARVGKCLFIDEKLYKPMFNFSKRKIQVKHGDEIDLAAFESYISLPSSSIIDTLEIKPENILLVDDYESIFFDDVIATSDIDGELVTREKRCKITNSIWDGQSLLDVSLFGKYQNYGMVLLRNLMFKSCCFNCNIQKWFTDNGITDVSQLNGKTRAKNISDIKMITTPNSIKYLKFDTFDNWLDNLYPHFGIVKHDKKTHFFGGRLVQTHYQLINTLQLSKDEVKELLKDSLDFVQQLKTNPAVVRYYIKYPYVDEVDPLNSPMLSKNDVVYNLMCVNDNFVKTKYYQEFLADIIRSFYKNLKNGHIFVNGNYSTLLGNPIEMLQQSIGKFSGESQIGVGNIHNTRFQYNQTLIASRSPHVTMGNIWLPFNTANEDIDKYFNLTPEIICINSINENVLQRLSGADFDSDTVLLSDNSTLITAAKRNYNLFKTPTSFVSGKKVKRFYTPEEQADLDIKTSVNKIGEIINFSQELNSLLWNKIHNGATYKDIKELYYDICQLDVMSGIEIDKAKKEFVIDNKFELMKMRNKYKDELSMDYYTVDCNGNEIKKKKKTTPHFFAHISRQKGYYNPERRDYRKYYTSMDYLQSIVNGFRIKNPYGKDWLPFVSILDNSKFYTSHVNEDQIKKIYELINQYVNDRKSIFADNEYNDKSTRYDRCRLLKNNLIAELKSERMSFSTMFKLLSSLENKENSKIKNVLLPILFSCQHESFTKAIIDSIDEVDQIEEGGNDIFLYGAGYKICKKRAISAN